MVNSKELIEIARKEKDAAYCPYSNFKVGAAVLGEDGVTYSGCNIENASYGLSICAERVAIFSAIASGNRKIKAIAVSCGDQPLKTKNEGMPCGACRQVMSEFLDDDTQIAVDNVGSFSLKELLPLAFELI